MAEEKVFEPITTQEQLDGIIKDRIARERAKYSDYGDIKQQLAEAQGRITEYEKGAADIANLKKTISERDATISGLQTEKLKYDVAHKMGLPREMAARLSGGTEEELMTDAESLSRIIGSQAPTPAPARNQESGSGSGAYASLLAGLKK